VSSALTCNCFNKVSLYSRKAIALALHSGQSKENDIATKASKFLLFKVKLIVLVACDLVKRKQKQMYKNENVKVLKIV